MTLQAVICIKLSVITKSCFITTGVVGMAAKPLVLPEPFSREASWEELNFHFSNVGDISEWDDKQKLKWLLVRLMDHTQTVFQPINAEARASYANVTSALMERFEPKSRKIRFQVEFQTRRKKDQGLG